MWSAVEECVLSVSGDCLVTDLVGVEVFEAVAGLGAGWTCECPSEFDEGLVACLDVPE